MKNVCISITISLTFVRKGSINNIPALVQMMAWRQLGDKPLSEPMLDSLPTHIRVIRPQWVKYLGKTFWRDCKYMCICLHAGPFITPGAIWATCYMTHALCHVAYAKRGWCHTPFSHWMCNVSEGDSDWSIPRAPTVYEAHQYHFMMNFALRKPMKTNVYWHIYASLGLDELSIWITHS